MGDDPPVLTVGTDVSAKYKGAFCEAKVKKVVRNIKCKVTLKDGGGVITVNDDVIKGTLRVGSTVEVKQDPKKDALEAVITKIQDCSQYTVVFDDGDITTLRRSALCLKSGRHFNESETLDQLPLTHPEHFSTPVISGRRGRRGRALSSESSGEGGGRAVSGRREAAVGRVVLVEAGSGAERRRPHQPAFPALVVAPTPQINVADDYLVRSFKDGRYYTVPKKEAREFRRGAAPLEWGGVEAALQFLNNDVLPPHWDRDALFNDANNTSDESSDDEPREEKDHFVAQLYKFMDDRGTPLNRNPTIANKDIDLYRLFRVVQKLGGYNRVTNQNQWKSVAEKMGFQPATNSITGLCKQAYKKFLHSFEDFYRKLGVTLVAHPRGGRTPPSGRPLIRDRDRLPPAPAPATPASASPASSAGTPHQRGKDSDKSETEKSEKEDKPEKAEKPEKVKVKTPKGSDGDDSADNQPLAGTAAKIQEKEKEKVKEAHKTRSKSRSVSKTRSIPATVKSEPHEKKTPKLKRPISSKPGDSAGPSRASRRPHVSTDSDSSGRASRCGLKKLQSRRSQSANSASSGNTIASNSSKRPRKRKITEPSANEAKSRSGNVTVKAQVGDKLKVYYGPAQSESKVTYEAKVIEISSEGMLRVHYTGWNTRYDEWINPTRIATNVTQSDRKHHNNKGPGSSRHSRSKRITESSARSDSDTDTDSEPDVKRPPKSGDEKPPSTKTPSKLKESKSGDSSTSSKPRKRPIRSVTTPTLISPNKKPRIQGHQGRDYDLNEIRSELKGLHTVKQEPDDSPKQPIKQEPEKEVPATSTPSSSSDPLEPPGAAVSAAVEKQPEDVYEFKEPEPFEIELHDEKKKRTHRIFDDISPSKYTSTLSKSLSEEISEDPLRARPVLRSPSLSPFRDFARDAAGRHTPEDHLFSLDDDSCPGDGSLGALFEGFTPAKNQETYSKKSKMSRLRELIADSPDSRADDEQSSEDDNLEITKKKVEAQDKTASADRVDNPKSPDKKQDIKEEKDDIAALKDIPLPKSPKPEKPTPLSIEIPSTEMKDEGETDMNPSSIPLPSPIASIPLPTSPKESTSNSESAEDKKGSVERDPEPSKSEGPPSPASPLEDTEEDKSEPDSPARIDVLPDPPPAFLLHSEGPKIAEKLLKAINSAKRLSLSPPPLDETSKTSKKETPKTESKSPVTVNKSPVIAGKSPVISVKSPVTIGKSPATVSKSPVISIKSPVSVGKSPVSVGKSLVTVGKSPVSVSKSPVNVGKSPVVVTKPPVSAGKSPITVLKSPVTVGKTPAATGKSPVNVMKSPVTEETKPKTEAKTQNKPDKKQDIDIKDSIFGEPSKMTDAKKDVSDVKKVKPKEASPPRLLSPINVLERRISVTEMPLVAAGKNNKVLSDTIQKLSSQINQAQSSITAPVQQLPVEDKSDSSDSEEASRRAVIDKLTAMGGWRGGPHATKSPGEWSAGETLLMLEDACKNQRKHSASVVVAGNAGEEEGSMASLLLCSETIPGSPAPEEVKQPPPTNEGAPQSPPTTPETSDDLSPIRERLMSQDSPAERKDEEEDHQVHENSNMEVEKPHVSRSRKASESSLAGGGARRGRRRRDTEEGHTPLQYNFYVQFDPAWDCQTRINVLTSRLSDLRKAYHNVKADLAAIDRRRKKLRRKEREAVKAAKAACS